MTNHIRLCVLNYLRIVLQQAYRCVARFAEEAAHLSGYVIVVDRQVGILRVRVRRGPEADSTDTVLLPQEIVVFSLGDSVGAFQLPKPLYLFDFRAPVLLLLTGLSREFARLGFSPARRVLFHVGSRAGFALRGMCDADLGFPSRLALRGLALPAFVLQAVGCVRSFIKVEGREHLLTFTSAERFFYGISFGVHSAHLSSTGGALS